MGRLPEPGGDAGQWGNILNDYLLVAHTADGSLKNASDITGAQADASAALTGINTLNSQLEIRSGLGAPGSSIPGIFYVQNPNADNTLWVNVAGTWQQVGTSNNNPGGGVAPNNTYFPGNITDFSALTVYDFQTSGFIEELSWKALSSVAITGARYGAPAGLAGATLTFLIQTGTLASRTTVTTSPTETIATGWNDITFTSPFIPIEGTTYWLAAVISGAGPHYYENSDVSAGLTSGDGALAIPSGENSGYTTNPATTTGSLTPYDNERVPLDLAYATTAATGNFPSDLNFVTVPSAMQTYSPGSEFFSFFQVTAKKDVLLTGVRMYANGTNSLTGYILSGTTSSRTVLATTTTLPSMTNGTWNIATFAEPYTLTAGESVWVGADIGPNAAYYYTNDLFAANNVQNAYLEVTQSGTADVYGGTSWSGTITAGGTTWPGWNAIDVVWESFEQ